MPLERLPQCESKIIVDGEVKQCDLRVGHLVLPAKEWAGLHAWDPPCCHLNEFLEWDDAGDGADGVHFLLVPPAGGEET